MRPGGQPNMQQIMKQAQKMQQQVAQAQAELAEAELTGTAGGGLVSVVVTGLGEFKSIKIDPKAVDPEDVADLLAVALGPAFLVRDVVAHRQLGLGLDGPAGVRRERRQAVGRCELVELVVGRVGAVVSGHVADEDDLGRVRLGARVMLDVGDLAAGSLR